MFLKNLKQEIDNEEDHLDHVFISSSTVWLEFCEPGLNCRLHEFEEATNQSSTTCDMWLFKSGPMMLLCLSLNQTRLILDKWLWLARNNPRSSKICLNGRVARLNSSHICLVFIHSKKSRGYLNLYPLKLVDWIIACFQEIVNISLASSLNCMCVIAVHHQSILSKTYPAWISCQQGEQVQSAGYYSCDNFS